jgi:hypothetical protein
MTEQRGGVVFHRLYFIAFCSQTFLIKTSSGYRHINRIIFSRLSSVIPNRHTVASAVHSRPVLNARGVVDIPSSRALTWSCDGATHGANFTWQYYVLYGSHSAPSTATK